MTKPRTDNNIPMEEVEKQLTKHYKTPIKYKTSDATYTYYGDNYRLVIRVDGGIDAQTGAVDFHARRGKKDDWTYEGQVHRK